MAARISKTAYFSMKAPNRSGEAARLLTGLATHGVNLIAFTGFPVSGGAQVDFVPYHAGRFLKVARKLGMKVKSGKTVFIAKGEDRAGATAAICSKLAKAGINMVAMNAIVAGQGRFGAMFWVKPRDVARVARVLGAR